LSGQRARVSLGEVAQADHCEPLFGKANHCAKSLSTCSFN
jgi:hypothetical protein